jgi:hypothetical protein
MVMEPVGVNVCAASGVVNPRTQPAIAILRNEHVASLRIVTVITSLILLALVHLITSAQPATLVATQSFSRSSSGQPVV